MEYKPQCTNIPKRFSKNQSRPSPNFLTGNKGDPNDLKLKIPGTTLPGNNGVAAHKAAALIISLLFIELKS
jgi:hypothetical protein